MQIVKRILIGLILVLAFAALVLWVASFRSNRGHFEVSVMINKPPSVVFAALLDPEMTKKWVSGVIEIKKLTSGEPRVGTRLLIVEMINGQRVEIDEEITYLEPPFIDKYTSIGVGDPTRQFTEYGEYRLKEVNGQTKFTMLSDVKFHGALYNFLEPILVYGAKVKFEGDQQRLKAILEESR